MKFELLNCNEFFENISMHIRPNQENAIWKMRAYGWEKKKEPMTLCWGDKQCTVSSSALSLIFRDYSVKLRILSSFCAYSPRIFVIHSRSRSVHIKFNHRFVPVPTISPSTVVFFLFLLLLLLLLSYFCNSQWTLLSNLIFQTRNEWCERITIKMTINMIITDI